eukprot:COSAG05_NODE_3752_length_1861_cov_6.325199_2_plen_145_part_01
MNEYYSCTRLAVRGLPMTNAQDSACTRQRAFIGVALAAASFCLAVIMLELRFAVSSGDASTFQGLYHHITDMSLPQRPHGNHSDVARLTREVAQLQARVSELELGVAAPAPEPEPEPQPEPPLHPPADTQALEVEPEPEPEPEPA